MRHLRLVLVFVLAVGITGCAMRARSIADIRDDPGRWDNRQVEVTGRVTSSWSVPLVPYGFYKIDDGSAEITVLSDRRGAPSRGALVRVRGNVREIANVGSNAVGLHIQERGRNVVRR